MAINPPNIILVVFDTMRRDALGCYSGSNNTPNIDNFAKESIVFRNAISPSSWTIPSHASLFLGKYPSEHGMHETPSTEYANLAKNKLLPKTGNFIYSLKKYGFNLIGYSANFWVSPQNGFDYGFNNFFNFDDRGLSIENKAIMLEQLQDSRKLISKHDFISLINNYKLYKREYSRSKAHGYPLVKSGRNIIEMIMNSSIEKPFFLFINLVEMHEPYTNKEMKPSSQFLGQSPISDFIGIKTYSNGFMNKAKEIYFNKSANESDYLFSKLVKFLKDSNAYDDSLMILTSDHGQGFKEKGFYTHGRFLFDELIEIPLIMKFPKNYSYEGHSEQGYQSLVDIGEFILQAAEGVNAIDSLNKQKVFSESFGAGTKLNGKENLNITEKFKTLNSEYKTIYKNKYKLTWNMSNGSPSEFKKMGKEISITNSQEFEDLKNELEIFSGVNDLYHVAEN